MTTTTTAPSATRRRATTTTGVGLVLAVTGVAGAQAAHAEDYTVRPGDTVSHIAVRTSVPVARIVEANGLDSRATIRVGQRLSIPRAGQSVEAPAPAPTAPVTAARRHVVVAGETVSGLALRYGTSTAAIVQANGLDRRAFIRVGQQLTIPGTGTAGSEVSAPAPSAPAASGTTHVVRGGDTVSGLALRYGTSSSAIIRANSLGSSAMIRIGQRLTIPSATGVTPPSTVLVGSTFAGRTYPEATVQSANQNKATLLAIGVPSKAEMQALVVSTARAMGVDPALAQAVAYQESGFNHTAVSPANAIGTMQVIPTSGQWASQMVGRQLNLLDPKDNVVAGVAILKRLVATSPDVPTAIAGYYQGAAGVRKYGMFPDTRRYVASVQTLMTRFA